MSFNLKGIIALQIVAIGYLQLQLWVGEGSIADGWRLDKVINQQQQENADLKERNRMLEAEVLALKNGLEAIEERARLDLGMVKKNETFFLLVD